MPIISSHPVRRSLVLGTCLAFGCSSLVGFGSTVSAQTIAAATTSSAAPKALFIEILEGEGELNDVHARTAREPIVEVQDENHKPVAGALVLFAINSGGGPQQAAFSGISSLTVRTGADGRAVAHGYAPTKHTGKVQITVRATVGALVVETIIHQTNYSRGGHLRQTASSHKAAVGAILSTAALIAAGALIITETQNPSSTGITVGQGSVSGARRLSTQR